MMCIKLVLFILTVTTLVHSNPTKYVAATYTEDADDEKIVGGELATEGEIPWQVSIQTNRGTQMCGGSIINEEWILTAAQCHDNVEPQDYRVRSGSLTYDEGGILHTVTEMIVHNLYDEFAYVNDIAVFRIDPPLVWDLQTYPVALPVEGTYLPVNTTLWVAGWGKTDFAGEVSKDLLKVDVPIVAKHTCDEIYDLWGGIGSNQICAGPFEGGKDSCTADTGGPLYLDGTVYGIASKGIGCAQFNSPTIYTEVSAYIDWIFNNTMLKH